MGQTLRSISNNFNAKNSPKICNKLPDLASWPPELSLNVLKNLNATDLCLAACVWNELARDELLWQALCLSEWPYTSVYDRQEKPPDFSYHKLYLTLDEATITFNADYQLGMNYLFKYELINNDPEEIAKLFFHSKPFDRSQVRNYLKTNLDVLQHLINLFDFSDQTLPTALRQYFTILVPDRYDSYLHKLVEKFSIRYLQCNQMNRHNSPESIYVLCFALMLLSTDLLNPQIKNKMSKREFIRNIRHALSVSDDEYYGHLYDDVYLNGHIVGGTCKSSNGNNKSHHSNILGKRFNMIL